jgi:acetyl-CoA acetyltransferase
MARLQIATGEGSVTVGNASPLNVGAAAVRMKSEERVKELGLKLKVRVRAMAVAGVDPSVMGIGPVSATHKAEVVVRISRE